MHLSRTRQDVTIDRQTLHMMYHIEYQEGLLALTFLNKVQVKECVNVKKKSAVLTIDIRHMQQKLWHQWKKRLIFSTFTMGWIRECDFVSTADNRFFCHCLHFVLQHFYYLLIELWSDKKKKLKKTSVPRFIVCWRI